MQRKVTIYGTVDSKSVHADSSSRFAGNHCWQSDLRDFGGGDLTSDVVEIYDVETDTSSQGPLILTKRGWFGAVLLDQKIYTIAGKTIRSEDEKARTGDPANYDIRDSVEVLDLTSQAWTYLQPIAAPPRASCNAL